MPESSSGCFETMRAYSGKIFRLAQHLDRLYASAKYLGVQIPEDPSRMAHRLRQTLASSGLQEAVVRIAMIPQTNRVASPHHLAVRQRRAAKRRFAFSELNQVVGSPCLVVQPVQPPSPRQYASGIRLAVVPTRRFPVGQIDPQAKFSARLGSVLAVMESHLRQADEALFTDGRGYVTESTASNFGIIRGGVFLAPPCELGLLAGVTWQALVEVAGRLKIPYRETPLTRHEIYNADEAFLSSTIKELLAVTRIDGRRIGTGRPGPAARRLRQAFRQLVRRELRIR